MAIINCPECSNSVSDKAAVCPRCGYPIYTSRLKERLSVFFRVHLHRQLIWSIKFIGRLMAIFIKPTILLVILSVLFIIAKNFYFIPIVEKFALQSCIAATGKTVESYENFYKFEIVQVPSELNWTQVDNRLGGILDWRNFDFELPGVGTNIRVIGRDGANIRWSCTPHIVSRSMFSKEPYLLHKYYWLHQAEY